MRPFCQIANLQVSLFPSMQPGPDFPKLEHPGTCSSTRNRGGEFCVSLRACVSLHEKGGAALSQRLL